MTQHLSCPAWPDCGCGTQSGPHTCEWRAECERRYRWLGIDVRNPNPDGSDYRLMNAVDADVTKEWEEHRIKSFLDAAKLKQLEQK